MSIRPTYRKRSVLQVLADGMSAHPPKPETHINVTADAASTPADFSEKLRKLSEEFKKNAQIRALRDAEGNVVEHLLTPRKFAAGGYVPSPEGGDKSCCEEAELTASELARRNEELLEAEVEIAVQKERVTLLSAERDALQRCIYSWESRAEKAEAERDEWKQGAEAEAYEADRLRAEVGRLTRERDELQDKLDDPYSEVNQKAAAWDRVEAHPLIGKLSELPEGDSYAERVGKRLDQLAEMESAITELEPAESHVVIGGKTPKWMRDEAERLIRLELGSVVSDVRGTAEKILALTPAAENRPTLDREAVSRIVNRVACKTIPGPLGVEQIMQLVPAAEQAATGDEDQCVEEQAERLYLSTQGEIAVAWESLTEPMQNGFRAAIRAGWTPPENEDEK